MGDTKTVADDQQSAATLTDEGSSAQSNDLDKLLSEYGKEFDEDIKKVEPPTETDRIALLERELEAQRRELTNKDIDESVDHIKRELEGINLSKKVIKGMLNQQAGDDPRMLKAFQNRKSDPAAWKRVLTAYAKTISKEFDDTIDGKLTDDRAALKAAVQGRTTVQQEDESAKMQKFFESATDQEFAIWKRTKKIPASYTG